jgi:hypothetical protein
MKQLKTKSSMRAEEAKSHYNSDSDKFKYILSSNDYDIMKICVIGISEMCSERNKLLKSNAK